MRARGGSTGSLGSGRREPLWVSTGVSAVKGVALGKKTHRMGSRVLVRLAAVGLVAGTLAVVHDVTSAHATTAPGANPANCPGGVLVPHAKIAINTPADWTAANGVTGGTGTAANPYVISCWSIQMSSSDQSGQAIRIGQGSGNVSVLIRDVQMTGAGGPRGQGSPNQDAISLGGGTGAVDIEEVTASGMTVALAGGASIAGSARLAHSLIQQNIWGLSGSNNWVVDQNSFTDNSSGIQQVNGSVTNNTISNNANGAIATGTFSGNIVENNDGYGVAVNTGATASHNTIEGNGTGVFPQGVGALSVVDQNTIVGNRNYGIDMSDAISGVSIANNTIQGNGAAAIFANASSPGFSATNSVIDGNHIGGSPFGIMFVYGNNDANVVENTDWTDGHQSIVRFTNQNTIVDAGSAHQGASDQPVFFHDYIAAVNLGPGPSTPGGNFCPQLGSCDLGPFPTAQYSAVAGVHWDFGDGQSLDLPTAVATQGQGPEPDVKHQYAATGSYTAKLTVTATTTAGQTVTFTDTTPVTIVSSPSTSLLPPTDSAHWPMLGQGPERSFFQSNTALTNQLTPANVAALRVKWRFPTAYPVFASPAISDVNASLVPGVVPPTLRRMVYDGTYDGNVYGIDDATGLPVWTQCIVGSVSTQTSEASCNPSYPGNANAQVDYGTIIASPLVGTVQTTSPNQTQGQVVFVAANATMDALDAATGKVLWSFQGNAAFAGEQNAAEDATYEIESSPVLVGNSLIFGMDCNGECAKGGGIYALDARDGHMQWFFDPIARQAFAGTPTTFSYNPKLNGPASANTCGGVWTSPAIDAAKGLLYASTANCATVPLPPYMEGVFALHISDGSPAWGYQPRTIDSLDMDYGATPNVFKLGTQDVVGAASKDGTYTLFDAGSGSVIWSSKVALGGGFGGFYNSVVDGNRIYLTSAIGEAGGDAATPVEESAKGREYALDARTGNVIWRQYAGAPNIGQNSGVPGVYLTGGLDHNLHAWDSGTGNPLAAFPLAGATSSTPAVAGNEVFLGAGTGATFRSFVGPNVCVLFCTPTLPHPIPIGEYGQGVYSFCLSTDPACVSAIGVINAGKHPTQVTYTGATSGDVDDPVTLSARLTDTSNSTLPLPVANKTITFSLSTQSCSGTTDATGTASCSLTPIATAGGYALTSTFSGDANYEASSTSTQFTVTTEETTLTYNGDTTIADGGTAHMSAVLTEDGTTPIGGRAVTFTLGSGSGAQSCAATTDLTGTARCTIAPVIQPIGPGTVTATFAGDSFFKPASASANVTLYAFTGTGNASAFVIGDKSAVVGKSVTFWGSSWSSKNTLSGGPAPSTFKGFANVTSPSPPNCGGSWTTSSGNSSSPPASLPQYIAVLVSSKITQSGSTTFAGNVPEIVAITINPGYSSNPGHGGTGTVMGVICRV